uniref:Crt2 n=1 Tax=Arundo donax TaxID=35708 RepID=A0A0A9EKW6_ARUDO
MLTRKSSVARPPTASCSARISVGMPPRRFTPSLLRTARTI